MKHFYSAIFLLIAIPLLLFSSCSKDSSNTSPEVHVNQKKLDEAFSNAKSIQRITSLVVARNGIVEKEEYFGKGTSSTPHDVRSVTKSVTSLLIGIAIDKGFINSIDQTIGDLKPLVNSIDSNKYKIKIRHLLTMSSGLKWNELNGGNEYNNWATSPNQLLYVLDLPFISEPGEYFNYNTGGTHLLSIILTRATGMKALDFAQKYLFDPMEISKRNWETDNQDYNNGGAGIEITPEDMVKIGELFLNNGLFKGKRIVSSEWIRNSTQLQISTNNAVPFGSGYGYCWWIGQENGCSFYFAMGWGGQFIFIVPELKLVITTTANWQGIGETAANQQWYNIINIIVNEILPAYKN